MEIEADTCPGCHGVLSETTAIENQGMYTVPPPTRCHRCTAIETKQEAAGDKYQAPRALFWTAVKRTVRRR